MNIKRFVVPCLALLIATFASTSISAEHHQMKRDSMSLGEVTFSISCSKQSNAEFNTALAMMHSFWYPQARRAFQVISKNEPDCAMAYWGVAISYFQQIWSKPLREENLKAIELLEKADPTGQKT